MILAFYILLLLAQLITAARILTRPNREPSARIAWVAVVFALPLVGVLGYVLLGETSIGRGRVERRSTITAKLSDQLKFPKYAHLTKGADIPVQFRSIFRLGESVSGLPVVGGIAAELMENSDTTIDRMVADIDAATDHVHLIFYIWLTDINGTKMIDALIRAAGRGVPCRAMVDDLGSRSLIKSPQWARMEKAGIHLCRALQIGNPLVRMFDGRVDLRNHRKILVIDNEITYCGSQNCADPAFSPKPKFAPWVDAMMRFTGPVVRQNQLVFAADWMTYINENLLSVVNAPMSDSGPGFPAQVIATGPTARHAAMPDIFAALMHSAQSELVITTPYYAPNEAMQSALRSAGNRGVQTTIVFPARNDDFAVAATCRSYYLELLQAGVCIKEYPLGLLHTKSMTVDGKVTLIGSANMDRRSFDLNFENNILLYDEAVTATMRARQDAYIADSTQVTLQNVEAWSWRKRLWNNTLATIGPVL